MLAYINYPNWMKPEIIPDLPFRWYAVMYIFAFSVTYLLMKYQIKKNDTPGLENVSEESASSFFIWVVLGLLIGARLFGTLVYDTTGKFWSKPWLIIIPFENGRFTGLSGMSYHGGLIGALLGAFFYCRRKKKNFLLYTDMITAGIPLGYTFGRLGNFINAELYGRVTASPLGMIFPDAEKLSMSESWVSKFAEDNGFMDLVRNGFVNLPRHPSQLYEAIFEGIILWAIIWFVFRKRKKFDGQIISLYIIGYGIFRFFIEYAREPDADLGYVISLVPSVKDFHVFQTFFNFSLGQVFCFLMILAGTGGLFYFRHRKRKKEILAEQDRNTKTSARKLRNRIK